MTKPARFRTAVERLAATLQMAAGAIILVTAIGVSVNALARYGLSKDIAIVTEAGGFVFLLVIFLGLAGTFLAGSHVSVELLSLVVPPRTARWVQEVVVPILCFAFTTVLIVAASAMTWRYFESGRMTIGLFPMPFWIFMAVVPVGALVLDLLLLSMIHDRLRHGPRGTAGADGGRPGDA